MSGGRIVVLDRLGRPVKAYPLAAGTARVGRAYGCHVRVLQDTVRPHHATLLVKAAQTVIRNESDGETLVNGVSVSVSALRHGDLITVGDRTLRWEYDQGAASHNRSDMAMVGSRAIRRSGGRGRPRPLPRLSSPPRPAPRSPQITAALDLHHRASMPASAGGKQVAIVQPQRRDHIQDTAAAPAEVPQSPRAARRSTKSESELAASKAELWIESRKTAKHTPIPAKPTTVTPKQVTPKPLPTKRDSTPRKVSPRKSIKDSTPKDSTKQSTPRESPRKSKKLNTPRETQESTPKVSPRKSTSKQNTPKEVTPRQNSAKKATPKQTTPKVTPKQAAKEMTPKQVTPLASTSKRVTPRQASPRQATLREATPRQVTPRQATPRQVTPRQVTPRQVTPRQVTPRQVTPHQVTPRQGPIRRVVSAKKATPLRLAVLRKAQSAHKNKVMKIEDPTRIDLTKQAAIMRMTGHTRPKPPSPSLLVKKPSPVKSPGGRKSKSKSPRGSTSAISSVVSPRRSRGGGDAVSVFEITDTESLISPSSSMSRSKLSTLASPLLPSPKKSALKDPKKTSRKTESIKFDLSNLESYNDEFLSVADDTTRGFTTIDTNFSDYSTTLRNSESLNKSPTPSPRKSIHSRSSKMLEQVGSPLREASKSSRNSSILTNTSTPKLKSPRSRSSQLIEKALTSPNTTRQSRSKNTTTQSVTRSIINETWDTTVESAFKSRTISPRNLEAYSVVDLVSDNSGSPSFNSQSLYDSLGTTRSSSILFGTPQTGRATRSAIGVEALTSSTPYNDRGRKSIRSNSSPNITTRTSSPKSKTSSPNITTRTSSPKSKTSSPNITRRTTSPKSITSSPNITRRTTSPKSITSSPNITQRTSSPKSKTSSPNITRRTKSPKSKTSSPNITQRTSSPKSKTSSPNITRRSITSNPNITRRTSSPKSITSSPNITRRTSSPKSITSSPNITRKTSSPKSKTSSPNIIRRTRSPKAKTSTTPRSQSLITPENTGHVSINSTKISRVSKSRSRINDTDLQFLDDTVEESPKSSRKSKPSKRKTNSPNITANKRGSRRKLTVDVTVSSQGTVTPENQNSPEEIGTPVLSIQSLLNSSLSSMSQYSQKKKTSPNIKRKTVGVLRSQRKSKQSPKSKSFTVTRPLRGAVKRLSGTNKETTPTSAVKLVQEAVKNKHSTAKKPQSKHSIIDDLNESAIVKSLFNSPVKRKLSQSMTEMSRKHLFDEEEAPKRTRNTFHFPRSPRNDSVLDRSEQFTPEQFVSPLSTPGKSPNTSRAKRSLNKTTPKNDLRNGSFIRTPKRNSVRNNDTNISQVSMMSKTSPRNRRSSVKVAEMASPPRSAGKKKGRSPKNDLTNMSGVRDLFKRKSVKNDLRRVSGVKRTFARSPKNNYSDLSGIEELFDQSDISHIQRPQTPQNDPERLFDQLLGKPPIKAVYSKSFLTGAKPKKLRRRSLRKSIELITNNVEEWIQQELNKSLHKTPSKTKTNTPVKSRVSKELQKLATDMVEGSEIRTSRARSSTITNSLAQDGIDRSVKLAYSARKLPIKKRSFTKASLESSGNSSRRSTLPIKKRVVVHSTPMKGVYDVTMNATEIRAVSPIAVVNITRMEHRSPRRTIIKSPKSKSPKHTSPKHNTPKHTSPKHTSPKKLASPKQTRRRGAKQVSESQTDTQNLPPKGRRTTKTKTNEETAVITSPKAKRATRGKAPTQSPKAKTQSVKDKVETLSPKPRGRRGKSQNVVSTPQLPAEPKRRGRKQSENIPATIPSPKPKRGRNQNQANKPDKTSSVKLSPKTTRGKKASPVKSKTTRGGKTTETNTKRRRNSLVITKKAPILSPKPTKKAEQAEKPETPKKTTRRQKESPKKVTPVKTKATRAKLVIPKPSPQMKPQGSRRGKKPPTPKASPKKAAKSTRKQTKVTPEKSPIKPATKRGRRNANVETELSVAQAKVASPKSKKGTKPATQKVTSPIKTSKRAANTQRSTEASPKRGRRANVTEPVKSPPKPRGRGRNVTEAIKTPPKTKRATKAVTPAKAQPKTKRGAKEAITPPSQSSGKEASPQRGRKRKAVDEPTTVPAKVAKSSPKPRGRQTKPNTPKGRSRSAVSKQTKVIPKNQEPTSQTKAKTTKSPAEPAKTKRGGAKAAKSPVTKATKVTKSPVKGAKGATKAAKSPAKGAKVTKSPAKGAKGTTTAKSPPKVAKVATKVTKSPVKSARGATKVTKSPANGGRGATKAAKSPAKGAKVATKAAKSPVKSANLPAKSARAAKDKAKKTMNATISRKIMKGFGRNIYGRLI